MTLIASSPTFFRNYLERSKPGQLATLVHMLLGSEQLKPELAEAIRETARHASRWKGTAAPRCRRSSRSTP